MKSVEFILQCQKSFFKDSNFAYRINLMEDNLREALKKTHKKGKAIFSFYSPNVNAHFIYFS